MAFRSILLFWRTRLTQISAMAATNTTAKSSIILISQPMGLPMGRHFGLNNHAILPPTNTCRSANLAVAEKRRSFLSTPGTPRMGSGWLARSKKDDLRPGGPRGGSYRSRSSASAPSLDEMDREFAALCFAFACFVTPVILGGFFIFCLLVFMD